MMTPEQYKKVNAERKRRAADMEIAKLRIELMCEAHRQKIEYEGRINYVDNPAIGIVRLTP